MEFESGFITYDVVTILEKICDIYVHCLPKVFWQRLLTGAKLPIIKAVWEGQWWVNLLVRWGHYLLGP